MLYFEKYYLIFALLFYLREAIEAIVRQIILTTIIEFYPPKRGLKTIV